MGLFDKIFGGSADEDSVSHVPWKTLEDTNKIDELIVLSHLKPVVIFKHSTRCGISRMVLNGFEQGYNLGEESIELYFLDLLKYRNVSNEVAQRFGVVHQSPQLIIVKAGEVVHHNSHGEIDVKIINKFI